MELSRQQKADFLETIWDYYARSGRTTLPWRQPQSDGSFDPYRIMVSELMLQQTQVARVIPKYSTFLAQFPTVQALARVELGEVLRAWQGLGYNRRAKFLWQTAALVHARGNFPTTSVELVQLPGVGVNTAGAILAYAYNQPVSFIETNVRTVYIHHFFADQSNITDKDILQVLAQTLEHDNPREFYWAIMDYGSYLKTTIGNLNTASKHYTKQSRFAGSRRQLRGQVLRMLDTQPYTTTALIEVVSDERLAGVLADLQAEGLVRERGGSYSL